MTTMYNGWTESVEQIAARRRRIIEEYADFPGDDVSPGLAAALTAPHRLEALTADYQEAMAECEAAAAELKARQAKRPSILRRKLG